MEKYIRTYAAVNLDAIEHNLSELKKCVEDDVKLCAIIKADAYGHGAVPIAHELKDKVAYFAVATADEALELRDSGIDTPILILSYTHKDEYHELIEKNVSMSVGSIELAKAIQAEAERTGSKALVHIALDTGMTRIGFQMTDKAIKDVVAVSKLPNVEIQGVFSHYACADMTDKSVSELQTKRFKDFVNKCEDAGVVFPVHHLCNSAAISEFSEHFDMVRMGISLYGLYPSDEIDKSKINLIPAMQFCSHVTLVKDVPEGEGISYGHTYHTTATRRIATVSAGYADGYPRALSGKGHVIVRGHFAPIVGRVCMDQFMIDVTDIPGVEVHDRVTLWGTESGLTISPEEIGEESMSFNYEVICRVARRIPRVYRKNGEIVKIVHNLR